MFRIARNDPWYVVVGVAGDVQNGSVESPMETFEVYEPRSAQADVWWAQSLLVRTNGDARRIELAAREIVRRLEPRVPVTGVDTASALIADVNARIGFTMCLMVMVSGVAVFLAVIGMYGSFSCLVRRRIQEIAVRIALGADPGDVIRMILNQSSRWALIGVAVGLPLAVIAMRSLRTLLYAISPADPATYAAVALLLVSSAVAATWRPALRASRLDPADALRAQ